MTSRSVSSTRGFSTTGLLATVECIRGAPQALARIVPSRAPCIEVCSRPPRARRAESDVDAQRAGSRSLSRKPGRGCSCAGSLQARTHE
ncbi:unnamed protein product [Ectocarpus sp. 12 AP-2014]